MRNVEEFSFRSLINRILSALVLLYKSNFNFNISSDKYCQAYQEETRLNRFDFMHFSFLFVCFF